MLAQAEEEAVVRHPATNQAQVMRIVRSGSG